MNEKKIFQSPKFKILKILERTGTILKIYRSGKTPKILRSIIISENFEEFIWFTRPDRWSKQALYIVSRLCFLNLNLQHLKRYYSLIIIPRFQESILIEKKINIHLFLTLKLASLRVKFFFSQFIMPFSLSSSCTKKEIIVLSALISKESFSDNHIICLLTFLLKKNPLTSSKILFLRIILKKNVNLPKRIIEYLLDFFFVNRKIKSQANFRNCYLSFFNNYFRFLSEQDKNKLKNFYE
jgi:essential nuclear protein 1